MTPPTAPDYNFDVRDRFPRSKLTLESIQPDLCAVLLQHSTHKLTVRRAKQTVWFGQNSSLNGMGIAI